MGHPQLDSDVGAVPSRVGLIAGGGRFPILVAEDLRRRGVEVICVGLRHQVDPRLREIVNAFYYLSGARLGVLFRFLHRHNVKQATWAGYIRKDDIFRPWRILTLLPDLRTLRFFFFKVADRQNQTLLAALADEFESEGIHVVHSTKYSPQLLTQPGVLGRCRPKKSHWVDIKFGWRVAKRMADLDVGQSVVVCEKSTLAVEGIEGTDENILRAGKFCRRRGFTVIKVAKEEHDMRFDIPSVGPDTILAMDKAGGAVLALEAGKTLIIDREEVTKLADRHGIVVIALTDPEEQEP